MGEIWIPEAIRLGASSSGGVMDTPGSPPRSVWHTTEGSSGTRAAFDATADYLIEKASEPHILYDPTTDMLGQFLPLNLSARALRNADSVRTNRTGKVCIQVEVMAKAAKAFTGYWKPGPNFRALLRAIRSWGIPDEWPAGRLAQSYSDDSPRPLTIWQTRGGHYGHSNVPGNDHWDPGAIDRVALLNAGATQPTTPPQQEDIVTPAEIQAIAAAVWNHPLPNITTAGVEDGKTKEAFWLLVWQDYAHKQVM
ncbi:peptidoglycan-binding protein LysM, partial [Streptomyces sp. NPDC054840]